MIVESLTIITVAVIAAVAYVAHRREERGERLELAKLRELGELANRTEAARWQEHVRTANAERDKAAAELAQANADNVAALAAVNRMQADMGTRLGSLEQWRQHAQPSIGGRR